MRGICAQSMKFHGTDLGRRSFVNRSMLLFVVKCMRADIGNDVCARIVVASAIFRVRTINAPHPPQDQRTSCAPVLGNGVVVRFFARTFLAQSVCSVVAAPDAWHASDAVQHEALASAQLMEFRPWQ
jgi:hypothetical protein